MTPAALRALQTEILANPACVAFVHTNDMPSVDAAADDAQIAAIVSAGRTRLRSHYITDRGVISALGTQAGNAFLDAIEGFAVAVLPAEHPLKADQAGIKRVLAWLKSDGGIELGDAQTQMLLGVFAQLGVVNAGHAATIMALGKDADPVSAGDVSLALRGPWGDE